MRLREEAKKSSTGLPKKEEISLTLNGHQLEEIAELRSRMEQCGWSMVGVGAAQVLFTLLEAQHHGHGGEAGAAAVLAKGVTVGDVSYWFDALSIGALMIFASKPFDRLLCAGFLSNHFAFIFEGLGRVVMLLNQLAIGSLAVSTVILLEAAAKWPPIVVGSSALFFSVAVLRSAAMWWVIARHASNQEEAQRTLCSIRSGGSELPVLERLAISLAFGYLLQFEAPLHEGPPAPKKDASGQLEYQFTRIDERLLRDLVQSGNTAGLAIALQAFATFMLVVAEFGEGDVTGVVSNGINLTFKATMSLLLFRTMSTFDAAIHRQEGGDVEHLVQGLVDEENSLAALFEKLTVLSWSLVLGGALGVVVPELMEHVEGSPMAAGAADVAMHRAADVFVRALTVLEQMAL